jgi:hypothetical protein
MRQLLWWFPFVVSSYGCSGNNLPLPPTAPVAPTPAVTLSPPRPSRDAGNWTPWFFVPWQPGVGPPLGLNITINAAVEPGELCISDIYWQWARERARDSSFLCLPMDGFMGFFTGMRRLKGST